ncbi:hypothetical protein JCM8202v2_001911 [Rhodotorula sphaerocarpa]
MNKIKQAFTHKDEQVVGPPTTSNQGDPVDDSALLGLKEEKPVEREEPRHEEPEAVEPKSEAHLEERADPPAHVHQHSEKETILSEEDAKEAVHDHQHLAPVTHEHHHVHEIEEVERKREVDRHIHHVQHHIQPVLDEHHAEEVVEEKVIPKTEIKESHAATEEDKSQFLSLNTVKDEVEEAPRERVIIDKGETVVSENVHHVVHHVVIERDTHEHHRIHTKIPIHQTVVEAPIVHASVQHEPLSVKDFVAGGGDLKSTLKHDPEVLLNHGQCERTVDGPAETITEQLGLTSLNETESNGVKSPGAGKTFESKESSSPAVAA